MSHQRYALRRPALSLESLEDRFTPHVDLLNPAQFDLHVFPAAEAAVATTTAPTTLAAAAVPVTSVPAYSSLPGAKATLYLDFNGHYEAVWGSYSRINTPAYSQDNDFTTFSPAEQANIQKIWAQVAEDYAPFNINVTTVAPTSFANGVSLRVAIGGNSNWLGSAAGGVGYVNSFTNSIVNTAYVFPANLANGYAKYVGEAVSHEAGHAFGLQHESSYSGATRTAEYSTGTANGRAPIMGNSYDAARGVWWYGTTLSYATYQDDMAVIGRSLNVFGYRPDDAGNTIATAAPLTVADTNLSGKGIIAQTADLDYWSFTTTGGGISFSISVPTGINNLDAKAMLVSATGKVIVGWQDPTTSFGVTLNATVAAGSYRLVVASHGTYGDVGQYTIAGTVDTSIVYVAPPTSLTAAAVSGGQVKLVWADNSVTETGYLVERSTNGGSYESVVTLAPNSIGYIDTSVASSTTYSYRVRAIEGSAQSDPSNMATVRTPATPPLAATDLNATVGTRAVLTWQDNSTNETSFQIQRSTNGGTWSILASVGPNVTTYSAIRPYSGNYSFRIVAVNSAGPSAPSNVVSVNAAGAVTLYSAPTTISAATSTSAALGLPVNASVSPSAPTPSGTTNTLESFAKAVSSLHAMSHSQTNDFDTDLFDLFSGLFGKAVK